MSMGPTPPPEASVVGSTCQPGCEASPEYFEVKQFCWVPFSTVPPEADVGRTRGSRSLYGQGMKVVHQYIAFPIGRR